MSKSESFDLETWKTYSDSRSALRKLRDPKFLKGDLTFKLNDDSYLYTQFLRATKPSENLIVHFHGAVERSKRTLPAFQPNVPDLRNVAHQISVCDPTMTSRSGFSISWYIGHENLPTQPLLCDFFREITNALGVERTVYCGSSGGGFASLYYSFFDKNSAAVVMVPQTDISQHGPSGWLERTYLAKCWPDSSLGDVSRHACTNVCDLYRPSSTANLASD